MGKIKILGLTADGACNVVEVYLYLQSMNLDYVICGKNSDKVKKIIDENFLHLMNDGSRFEYSEPFLIKSGKNKVQVKLIIVKR